MTCIEAIIFSLLFHWAYSPGEYKEGMRNDRYGTGPAQRTRTFKAIFDALNMSDVIIGTLVAIKLAFQRLSGKLGQRAGSSYNPRNVDATGMEPLSGQGHAHRGRGFSGGSDFDAGYSPERGEDYEAGLHQPAMPRAARDPSPNGRHPAYRAEEPRPGYGRSPFGSNTEYQPLTAQREPSPSGFPRTDPREMM